MKRTSAFKAAGEIAKALGVQGYEAAVFRFYEDKETPAPFHVRVGRRWPYDADDQTFVELADARARLARRLGAASNNAVNSPIAHVAIPGRE